MTLYATDLDGTLLDDSAKLSETSAQLFRQLQAEGAKVTFVTARTPATVEPILEPAQPMLPGVVMTGAAIWNPAEHRYESVTYHKADDVRTILDICSRHEVTPFVYTLPLGTVNLEVYHDAATLNDLERQFIDERTISTLKTFHLNEKMPDGAEECTVLFFGMGNPTLIRAAAEEIREATGCYASWYPDTYHPGVSLLEVFAPGVSKANGLLKLKQMLGADRVIAFGDNLNDIPMLEAADFAIAVDNAYIDVKAAAHKVIGPNSTDSVMRFIANAEKNRTI